MHYGIVAIGSRGDVQPYVALALGLQERGHQATIMAHENFRTFVTGYGIGFRPLHGSVEGLLKTDAGLAMLRSGSILAFARYLKQVIKKTQKEVNRDMMQGAENADVLICSLLAIPWIDSIAEKLKKPWAIVQLNLPATRTSVFPLAAIDFFNFPAYNKLTYRLLEFFHWFNNSQAVNAFRKSMELPPLELPVLRRIVDEKILNLYCFSPALCERPADWPAGTDITGFLFLPGQARASNPADVPAPEFISWLQRGPAPVYIGFGSIPIPDPPLFIRVLHHLLENTSERLVFCQGWSMPMDLPSHPRFFHLEKVNHDWLFPRCRAAVIHGGVGTTAAALKAGIPLVIVSIIADQPWWGKIIAVKKLGVHIRFRKTTPEKLALAIAATKEPEIIAAASALGERLREEDGTGKTIALLEQYFAPQI